MDKRHIHFIGIGGIGVSALAQLALKKGARVSGSDIKESSITLKLVSLGIPVTIGHRPDNIKDADLVVYSSAVAPENSEMAAARVQGVPVKKRAEFLCDLMAEKKVITVTGAHGKTTTSSLAAKLLTMAGMRPTVAVGGILREDGENNAYGEESPYFVAEADESDGTFLCYEPVYSIITNIDREHLDFYGSYEKLLEAFSAFIGRTKKDGCVFYCKEDASLEALVKKSGVRSVSFGYSSDADFYAQDISLGPCRLEFICGRGREVLGGVEVALMGRHHALNALGVIALGTELEIPFGIIRAALKSFKGVERRFQVKYEDKDIFVVDDYAHHPTEIAATIEAARACTRQKVIVVFQPHRYSRTQLLLNEFPRAFAQSDHLVLTDIYPAGEKPLAGIDARRLAQETQRVLPIPVEYVAKEGIVSHLKGLLQPDTLVLFLGAGDITKISDAFVQTLKR